MSLLLIYSISMENNTHQELPQQEQRTEKKPSVLFLLITVGVSLLSLGIGYFLGTMQSNINTHKNSVFEEIWQEATFQPTEQKQNQLRSTIQSCDVTSSRLVEHKNFSICIPLEWERLNGKELENFMTSPKEVPLVFRLAGYEQSSEYGFVEPVMRVADSRRAAFDSGAFCLKPVLNLHLLSTPILDVKRFAEVSAIQDPVTGETRNGCNEVVAQMVEVPVGNTSYFFEIGLQDIEESFSAGQDFRTQRIEQFYQVIDSIQTLDTESSFSLKIDSMSLSEQYRDPNGVFSISYPDDYEMTVTDSYVRLFKQGVTQEVDTGLSDYASVVIEVDQLESQSLLQYTEAKSKNPGNGGLLREVEATELNGYAGYAYTSHGMGFNKHHILQSGTNSPYVVDVITAVVDPANEGYQDEVDAILETVQLLK